MPEVIEQRISGLGADQHPAVDAWLTLNSGNRRPGSVASLYASSLAGRKNRDRRKSSAYSLDSAGLGGGSVVAKLCDPKTAGIERNIYEHILPQLPISSLHYYGHVETGGAHWLFLEHAGGVEWEIENRIHLELAIHWMAEMHGNSAHLDTLSLLPYRGPGYYLSQLTAARQRMMGSVFNPALTPANIGILEEFITSSGLLEKHWEEIEAFCATMPETLVHNDFVSKNVHVRMKNSRPVLLAFDWEMSGRGVPAVDLYWFFQHAPDGYITRYWEHMRRFNKNIGLRDIEKLAILGAIFRIMDAVEWVSQYLLTDTPDRKIHHTRLHTDRLKHACHALGWS